MRNLLVILLSTISVPVYSAAKDSGPVVKLKMVAGVPIVDDVYLDGQGPYRFLLDTGAETNLLEAKLARKLGIEATFQSKLITAAGTSAVGGTNVGLVSLGPVEAADQQFLFTSLAGVHALSSDIRGILGQPFLSHFDYTLDFQNHELVFGKAAPAAGSAIPFRLIRNRMAISTNQGDLVVDSGISMLFLFRRAPLNGSSSAIQAASGLTSLVSLDRVPGLRIGERMYNPGNAAFAVRDFTLADGLCPASLFHALFVSNSGGYVVIDPRRQR
jgi:hypothetical protein